MAAILGSFERRLTRVLGESGEVHGVIANFQIARSRSGSAIVLRLHGPLSASSTARLIEEVGQLLDQPAVLIDVRAVTEVDDVALATMTEYLTRAAVHGPAFAFLTTRDSCRSAG